MARVISTNPTPKSLRLSSLLSKRTGEWYRSGSGALNSNVLHLLGLFGCASDGGRNVVLHKQFRRIEVGSELPARFKKSRGTPRLENIANKVGMRTTSKGSCIKLIGPT